MNNDLLGDHRPLQESEKTQRAQDLHNFQIMSSSSLIPRSLSVPTVFFQRHLESASIYIDNHDGSTEREE